MALKRNTPVKNVVVVKNVVNNYNVSYPTNPGSDKHRTNSASPPKRFKIINPSDAKRIMMPKTPGTLNKQILSTEHRGSNVMSTSIVSRRPFSEVSKDKTSKDMINNKASMNANQFSFF